MKKRFPVYIAVLILLLASWAGAEERPHIMKGDSTIFGASRALNKAAGDTIPLMGPTGSGAAYLGDFEAGWNGWTSDDVTQATETHWQVSDYNQSVAGNLAAWCGDIGFDSCNDSLDAVGGYGHSWHDIIEFRQTVANPGL